MACVLLGSTRILSIRTEDVDASTIRATIYELTDDAVDCVTELIVTIPDELELEARHVLAYTGGHMYAAEKAAEAVRFDGELHGAYHGAAFVFVAG